MAAAVPQEHDKKELAKLKEEIQDLLANEGGKLDAGVFKNKYKNRFGKKFNPPKHASTKLTEFLQTYMNDVVEITRKRSINFIELKSKSKETVAVKQNATETRQKQTYKAPTTQTAAVIDARPLLSLSPQLKPQLPHSVPRANLFANSSLAFQKKQENVELVKPVSGDKDWPTIQAASAAAKTARPHFVSYSVDPHFSLPPQLKPQLPHSVPRANLFANSSLAFQKKQGNVELVKPVSSDKDWPTIQAASAAAKTTRPHISYSVDPHFSLPPRLDPRLSQTAPKTNYLANSSSMKQRNVEPGHRDVKTEVQKIIEDLAKENYVHVDIVAKRLFERLQVKNAIQLGYRRNDEIPGIKELVRKQREINVSIQAFVFVRSVSTLWELSEYLTNFYSDAREFKDINVGPLVKQPLVFEYFKFPQDQEPPDITTIKVMKYFKQFLTEKKLWGSKVKLEDFLEYLTKQMSCSSPYELGVRIQSIGLIIAAIRRCSTAESSVRKEAEKKLNDEIAVEIEEQLQKIKKRLLGGNQIGGLPDPDALVNRLLDLSPVDILVKLFKYCEQFFQGKVKKTVTAFISTCTSDRTCRKLFQLVLHKACRDLVKPLESPAHDGAYIDGETSDMEESFEEVIIKAPLPPKDELLREVKRWLMGGKSGTINIKLLARVEEHVLHRYEGFETFKDLGHGPFLQFLSEDKELQALLSLSSHPAEGALGAIRKADVLDLIQQCGLDSDPVKIANCVRAQFKRLNDSFESESLKVLTTHARQQQASQQDSHGVSSWRIIYEACLVGETLEPFQVETSDSKKKKGSIQVGLLGYQEESKALMCLYQTPLLEDYAVWSNWDHVFAPTYGNLKEFLRKDRQVPKEVVSALHPSDLVAMETANGCLLRVTRSTSTRQFLELAKDGDVIGTSGHLVSLILDHGALEKAPVALLANHMQEALLFLSSSAELGSGQDVEEFVVKFAVRCLKRIPDLMRVALAMQIFIKPLKHVFGNVQAPGLVLKYCETCEERSMIHALGVRLGITEWLEDFKKKLEFSASEVETPEEIIDRKIVEGQQKSLKKPNDKKSKEKESAEAGHDETDVGRTADNDEEKLDDNLTDNSNVSLESDELDLELSEKERHCRTVINSIRRDQFGIGIELPPEHRQMMENQRSREGRGLHRLSSELYSKDTHFVLELVQNADDNRYPEQQSPDEPPSIAFFVNIDKIVVLNNEVGFEEKNIRALCDVGKSTKGKHRYGYIGQKGIGFKSVFRVTDTPEVHSNGYHVKFDAKSGPTGYILPHWCDLSDEDSSTLNVNWTTRIVLTLKDEMKNVQKKTLIARFHDIQPSLLLFLRRLRRIKIMDEVSNTSREMLRRDLGENIIELKHSKGVDLWFVVQNELPASSMKADIETTEVALAFPLPTTNSDHSVSIKEVAAHIRAKSLIQQPVFAFLPLRSYGFRFIAQADFDVPSSREDVDKDSAWNQWLRQEISSLFVQAFDEFKNHRCFVGVASIAQFLQFIPLENEILDFFKPVTRIIMEGLCRQQCIPVCAKFSFNDFFLDSIAEEDQSENSDVDEQQEDVENVEDNPLPSSELKWVFPSQVVVAEDHLIEELISDNVLCSYLSKYYLHPDLEQFLNPPLRRALGIETLSCRHLIDIGKAISGKVTTEQNEAKGFSEKLSCWVAKWLCGVYRCLERERDCSEETLQEIGSLNLYPLSGGHCTKLCGQPVFLPLEKTVKGEQTRTRASKTAAEVVHQDLRSLHPMILSSLDDIERPQVRKLLERLQVRCLTSRDLIKYHIIPSLQSNLKQMDKPPNVIFSYIIYIKEQWDLDSTICDLGELRGCALLQTNKGFINPSLEPVHFTVDYGNETNLEKDFPSVPWTLVDKAYLGSATSNTWENFFLKLGVVHFLAIERKDVCLSKSELSRSVWSSLSDIWRRLPGDGCYIIKDYACGELEKLLSVDSASDEELTKLVEILDKKWDNKYARYTEDVPYVDEQGRILGQTYSSFYLNLKEKSWLPSRRGMSSGTLIRSLPRDIFLTKPEVIDLLGDHVLYTSSRLTNQNFLKALGIQTNVKFHTLVEELMKWVEKRQSEDDQESSFETSIQHMSNVYKFLASQIRDNDENHKFLEDVTRDKPVVFVPKDLNDFPRSQDLGGAILGEFVATKHVYWADPSNMMQKLLLVQPSVVTQPRRMLQNCYPFEMAFFVDFLKIDESPNLKEYVGLMEAIASQSSMASGPIVDEIMRVYDVVGSKCMNANQDSRYNAKFIKKQLTSLKVFPTLEDKWVSLDDKPLFSDDKALERLFRENESKSPKNESDADMERVTEKVHFLKMGLPIVKKPKSRGRGHGEKMENEDEKIRIRQNVRAFFEEVCGIRNLSECVSQEIIPTQTWQCPALQLFLYRWIPYVQRFLFCKHEEQYYKHQDEGIVEALAKVRCFGAKKLEVVHRLFTHPLITISTKKTCAIEKNDFMIFYVTDSDLKDTKDLIKELAGFLVPQEKVGVLDNFLLVLTQTPEDRIESFMEHQDVDSLPDDVQIWKVPEPEPVVIPVWEAVEDFLPEAERDTFPEVGTDQRHAMNEMDGEPRGLQSWPPKSSAMLAHETSKNTSTEQVLTLWPPPAPPETYSALEVGNQATADQDQARLARPVQSNVSNADVRSSLQPDGHPLADTGEHSRPRVGPLSVEHVPNRDTPAAQASNLGTRPRSASLGDVIPPQRLLPRPLILPDGDISVELEEIQLGNSVERTELLTLTQNANAEEIGRWGESCVYTLLQKLEEGKQDLEIIWVNEHHESGLPYDIIIKQQSVETVFIEVKSTSSPEKHVLEISSQEIQCAFQKKEKFHLYRVYNAGNPSGFRVSRLCNLAVNLDKKAVKLFIVI